jgi:hypothetical protein
MSTDSVLSKSQFADLFTNISDQEEVSLDVALHSPPFIPGQSIAGEVSIRNRIPIEVSKIGLNWYGLCSISFRFVLIARLCDEDVVWYQGLFQNERVAGKKIWLDERQLIFPLTEGIV